jgi:methionyl-tRNA formyltransferase
VRVFVITQDEPIYAPRYLAATVEKSRHEFVGVTALAPGGKHGFWGLVRERWRLYGTVDFLRAGKLYVRSRMSGTVASVARANGIEMVPCTKVNDPDYIDGLRRREVDVLVSIAANQLFKGDLLAAPRVAAVNLHSALLPSYRGLDGLFWALVHGETTVGVSAHLMTEKFDEGGILGQAPFPVPPKATLHDLYLTAIDQGSTLLAEVLDQLEAGTATPRVNDVDAGSYFSAPTPEAAQEFRRRGNRFFP